LGVAGLIGTGDAIEKSTPYHAWRPVFSQLFNLESVTDPAARRARMQADRSILDSVTQKAVDLERQLGTRDRAKLAQYLDAVRDVERRIQKAEAQSARELPVVEQPPGVPDTFEDYATLMFDLQVLAYQSDLTRIITFMIAPELSARTYPEIGVPDSHHGISHHQGNPDNLAKLTKIGAYHTKQVAYFLEKLQSTADGDGCLLDHVTLIYGRGMADSNAHTPIGLPIVVAGGGAGQIKGGRHIRFAEGTPLSNLYLSVLNKVGVPVEAIGDSTGELHFLSDV